MTHSLHIWLVSVALLAGCTTRSHDPATIRADSGFLDDAADGTVSSAFIFRDTHYSLDCRDSDIRSTPPWDSRRQQTPPLPPAKAVALANASVGVLFPEAVGWQASTINLERLHSHTDPYRFDDRWYYTIYLFEPRFPGYGSQASFTVIVLMDGRVIMPTKTKSLDIKLP